MNDEQKMAIHKAQVEDMFQEVKDVIEKYDAPVVMHTMMIVMAMIGQQTDMEPEHFKAFVVTELDRLMLVTGDTHGLAQ